MSKHPIQSIRNGRFVQNEVVRWLLDNGGKDMNDIAVQGFPQEDLEQFAQLIGYSLNGFGDLSYVSDDTYSAAEKMNEGLAEKDARVASLEGTLAEVRTHLRAASVSAFAVHPDDLQSHPSW